MPGGDIINATNCSSDNGFAKVKSRFRSGGMVPFGAVFCVAEASHVSTNGFNLRFVSRVACAPRSFTLGCESATCVAYDSVCCFRSNPKQAVGNRRNKASTEEFSFSSYEIGLCLSTVFSANYRHSQIRCDILKSDV